MITYLYAYFREFLGNFFLGAAIFSLFFFFGESSRLFEIALLMSGADTALFGRSLGYLYWEYWVSVCFFILPMSVLLGVILTNARLQEDLEFLALETLGMNIQKLMLGLMIVMGLGFSALVHPMIHTIGPQARLALKRFAYLGKNTAASLRIEPKTWFDLGHTQIFAGSVKGLDLEDVVIYSTSQQKDRAKTKGTGQESPYKVTGRRAYYNIIIENDPGNEIGQTRLFLKVFSGKLEYPDLSKPGFSTVCSFDSYENYIGLEPGGIPEAGIREKATQELKLKSLEAKEERLEIGSRQALAFSPLVLCLVGALASLGMQRRSKGFGFGLALALLCLYWVVFVMMTTLELPWATNWSYFLAALLMFGFRR